MELLDLFGKLPPFVQMALVVGSFALLFLVACSRTAANNLLSFLSGLCEIAWGEFRSQRRVGKHGWRPLRRRRASVVLGGSTRTALRALDVDRGQNEDGQHTAV